ncbi:hypothetical protein Vi05172_g8302 [Venturia inaequalis]|nr:hypothetical protein Vi05172_g8302 [Venturia inaequalis]
MPEHCKASVHSTRELLSTAQLATEHTRFDLMSVYQPLQKYTMTGISGNSLSSSSCGSKT